MKRGRDSTKKAGKEALITTKVIDIDQERKRIQNAFIHTSNGNKVAILNKIVSECNDLMVIELTKHFPVKEIIEEKCVICHKLYDANMNSVNGPCGKLL